MSDLKSNLPAHVAIIMDGNGRWAEARGLKRSDGHKAGAEPVRTILKTAHKMGIKYLTLYAFSTENWARSAEEIQSLFALLIQYLDEETTELLSSGVKLNAIGDLNRLPASSLEALHQALEATSKNSELTLTLALSYGSRTELTSAFQSLTKELQTGSLNPDEITEETINGHLWTASLPDPDLLIRTGGDKRLSNFLLWQLAYAELYFTNTLWPDFGEDDFRLAISDFMNRKRRFGRTD